MTVSGLTHASSVIPFVRSRESASATVTMELVPLNERALPNFPADAPAQVVLASVPALPFPDWSTAVVPLPASKPYAATRPLAGGAVTVAVASVEGELVLRVNVRDLPRGPGDNSGARRHEVPATGMWMDFTEWAWNENWVAVEKAASFVPKGTEAEPVDPAVVNKIAREVLVDNVRGQAPQWQASEVKQASMTMKRLSNGRIEYVGSVSMASGSRGYDAKLYGQAQWGGTKFTEFDIVVMGTRRGAAQFNQRENDRGPAPMGVTLSLSRM